MREPGDDGDGLSRRLAADLNGTFEEVVLTYQDRLYRFAFRLTGSSQDAEEIAQDAFIRAYRALAQYPSERIQAMELRPWLYRICLNVARNRLRRRRPELVLLDGDLPDEGAEQPEQAAQAAERVRELADLLASLTERYRTAVVLRHIEELSIAEIAAIVGQPEGTVKSNIHRGIQLLRRAVTERNEVMA